jgi:anti-sigma B factor antagonist
MKIDKQKNQQGIEIFHISGRLDPLTSNQLDEELNKSISSGSTKLVLDLSEVDFISSSGLRVFLTGLKKVKAQNGDLKICGMNSNVEKIFKIAGFVALFDIHPTEAEAVQKFS